MSEIVKIYNKKFNGDRSAVKVLVNVDTEQKCFQFSIEITQTLFQHVSLFLFSEKIAAAKEIAEWIGIIGVSGSGLFQFYKWMAKQNVSLNELDIEEDGNSVTISNSGDNSNITINNNTYIIMNDKNVLKNVKDVVRPLTNEGYDKLQFEQDEEITEEISSEEGKKIYNINMDSLELQPRVNKTTYATKLKVKNLTSWGIQGGHSF